MSILFDPEDPSQVLIENAAVGDFGVQANDVVLSNVHSDQLCAGQPCVIHNPSQHHMSAWALNWRDDRGLMERLCPHGIGHPDPDAMHFQRSIGRDYMGVHGCDGCCVRPDETT